MNKFASRSGARRSSGKAANSARDYRANQRNPNNDRFYQARGLEGRPCPSPGEVPGKPHQR